MKEYFLGLDEVLKILNEEDLDEVTRDNLMEEKVQIIETIDEQRNERLKKTKYLKTSRAKIYAAVKRGK